MPPKRAELSQPAGVANGYELSSPNTSFQTNFLALAVERGLVDSEDLGGFGQVGGSRQNFAQMRFFQFLDGNQGADLERRSVAIGFGSIPGRQFRRQILKANLFSLRHDDAALNRVAQFTEVARPCVGANAGEGLLGKFIDAPAT